jgi:hypothetical protein
MDTAFGNISMLERETKARRSEMMRLGSGTGSLVNHIYSRSTPVEPEVGMGATRLSWTDRHPATVTEVFKKGKYKYFTIREDLWEIEEGFVRREYIGGEGVPYRFFPSKEGEGRETTYRIKESGYECVFLNPDTGRFLNMNTGGVIVGRREKYHDPHF